MKTDQDSGISIELKDAGKKYIREWVFRHADLIIESGDRIVITGPNGSGKSTLLQVISGSVLPTEGTIHYRSGKLIVSGEDIFRRLTMAAPYLELIEEYTLEEILQFHFGFKKCLGDFSIEDILNISGLEHARKKVFRNFSSGMKQRTRLTLALLSESSMILLDEPCSNLDRKGILWYQELVNQFAGNRTILVCSNNQEEEYSFCNQHYEITRWKQ